MQLAIDKAWRYQLLTYPNPAVGATVVCNDTILSVEAHKEAGKSHAEVLALKAAFLTKYPQSELQNLEESTLIHHFLINNHSNFFKECEIYVTLEPCNHIGKTPACAMLLEAVGIKKVYIGTLDPNNEASGGLQRLKNTNIEVEVGICKKETDALLYPFIKWKKDNFVFFKLAMREDGSVDGGYITTQQSLNLVHQIRTKIDLLLISGKTVRDDRPTLDTRFSNSNKNPDIFIYSTQKKFDENIPLFHINNRKVDISNTLKILEMKNFIMCEGGYTVLEKIKDKLDYLMLFISHKEKQKEIDIAKFGFQIVHSYFINEHDEVVFLAKD